VTSPADRLRARVGETRTYTAPEELGAAACRYFALAVGDDNPLYTDADHARAHGLDGVTAPPTLVCETNQYAGLPADAEGYAGHTWGLSVPGTRTVRGSNSYVFERRIRPDDVLTATWQIVDVAEKATRSGAPMVVVTSRATYTDRTGALLATNDETIVFVSLEAPT
jgi:acyl dehydratase